MSARCYPPPPPREVKVTLKTAAAAQAPPPRRRWRSQMARALVSGRWAARAEAEWWRHG